MKERMMQNSGPHVQTYPVYGATSARSGDRSRWHEWIEALRWPCAQPEWHRPRRETLGGFLPGVDHLHAKHNLPETTLCQWTPRVSGMRTPLVLRETTVRCQNGGSVEFDRHADRPLRSWQCTSARNARAHAGQELCPLFLQPGFTYTHAQMCVLEQNQASCASVTMQNLLVHVCASPCGCVCVRVSIATQSECTSPWRGK